MSYRFSIAVATLLMISQPVFSHGQPQEQALKDELKAMDERITKLENSGSSGGLTVLANENEPGSGGNSADADLVFKFDREAVLIIKCIWP